MRSLRCRSLAAPAMLTRRTHSIWARNSWVRWKLSECARSWVISNRRARRGSTRWKRVQTAPVASCDRSACRQEIRRLERRGAVRGEEESIRIPRPSYCVGCVCIPGTAERRARRPLTFEPALRKAHLLQTAYSTRQELSALWTHPSASRSADQLLEQLGDWRAPNPAESQRCGSSRAGLPRWFERRPARLSFASLTERRGDDQCIAAGKYVGTSIDLFVDAAGRTNPPRRSTRTSTSMPR
jgi:hypothetical protein